MEGVGLWYIDHNSQPQRLYRTLPALEGDLESWIEAEPNLIQPGIKIVGRQFELPSGNLIDLVGVTSQGTWVIIEIKRSDPDHKAIGQSFNYVSEFRQLTTHELEKSVEKYLLPRSESTFHALLDKLGITDAQGERNVKMVVVGSKLNDVLENSVKDLRQRDIPASLITIEVFKSTDNRLVLARELHETEHETRHPKPNSLAYLRQRADQYGTGEILQTLLDAARENQLSIRSYQNSVGFTPGSNKSRTLFNLRIITDKVGVASLDIIPETFSEFYPVSEVEVIEQFGNVRKINFRQRDAVIFASRLSAWLSEMQRRK